MHKELSEKLRETASWNPSVVCRRYAREAADVIDTLDRDLRECKNELCLKCGAYKTRHLDSCDGCRWNKE